MSRLVVLVMGLLLGVALATNPLVVIGDKYSAIYSASSTSSIRRVSPNIWSSSRLCRVILWR